MTKRSPVGVIFLFFVTFGIYSVVWFVETKNEMNRLGANIPAAWLLFVPFFNFRWFWIYGKGVALVTNGAYSPLGSFLLMIFLGPFGNAILQGEFNRIAIDRDPMLAASAG